MNKSIREVTGIDIKKIAYILGVLLPLQIGFAGERTPFSLTSDEFPIGIYCAYWDDLNFTDIHLASIKRMGISYVHSYGMGRSDKPDGIARDLKCLDLAQKHGLKVFVNLGTHDWIKEKNGMATFKNIVRALKNHPAVGFWYLYDEPDLSSTPDAIRPYYQYLKKETPNIPVSIVVCWSKEWYKFHDVEDILMVDNYPVMDERFPNSPIQTIMNFTREALALGKPVMPVLQCMSWKVFPPTEAAFLKGRDMKKMRYPNGTELRYWMYASLAQGVRGLMFFSYYHAIQLESGWMKATLGPVVREVREFTTQVAPAYKPIVLSRGRDNDAYLALWPRKTGDFLVLVNSWPLERNLNLWMEDRIMQGKLEPWGQTRKIPAQIKEGRLNINVQPWEVFVWKVVK